jgi:hypothetical protein
MGNVSNYNQATASAAKAKREREESAREKNIISPSKVRHHLFREVRFFINRI